MSILVKRPKLLLSLPSFSPVASRLLGMASQERVHLKDVGDLIEIDPALSSDILRLVNSPLYARRFEITGIVRAVALVGLEAIRAMVLSVALRNFSQSASGSPVFRQCWRHSLATALLAYDLGQATGADCDIAYSLGLLHDSGRLAFLAGSPVAYTRLLMGGAEDNTQMMAMERELFDLNHCEAGEWLGQEWRMPDDYRYAMAHHHDYKSDGPESGMIVHLACDLANMAGFQCWGSPRDWNTTELHECLPDAGPSILDAGELIPRLAERINALELTLNL